MAHTRVASILESSLYVKDLKISSEFFKNLFGFSLLLEEDRMIALNVADHQVLLLFKNEGSLNGAHYPGGHIPSHDGKGPVHIAFLIPAEDFESWRDRLQSFLIHIESTVKANSGQSIYFRDPDDHLVELATPGLWKELRV